MVICLTPDLLSIGVPQVSIHSPLLFLPVLNDLSSVAEFFETNMFADEISVKIGILRSLRTIVPIHTLKQMYTAIVQPHFDYEDMVYDSASGTNTTRLH